MLAWYSFAASVVQSCGLIQVTYRLSGLLKQPENTVRQRLRESLDDTVDKCGSLCLGDKHLPFTSFNSPCSLS